MSKKSAVSSLTRVKMSNQHNPGPVNKTVQRQPSRVFGQTSIQSLHSQYKEDEQALTSRPCFQPAAGEPEKQTEEDAEQPEENGDTPELQVDSHDTSSQRKESMWSIWTRKASQLDQRPRSLETDGTQSTSAASVSSAHTHTEEPNKPDLEADKPEADKPEDASIKSKEDRKDSWMAWSRKPSKKLDDAVLQNDNSLKSVAGDAGKDSKYSWSFWNNSTSKAQRNDPSLSNILLSGGEAILFEPTIGPKNVKKEDHHSNVVVPAFEDALPHYSAGASIITNVNRLRYTLGFEVAEPKHLYRTSSPPKSIKKVLIIGVHGFFPTKVIRPLIGEPTGTSIKFANEAEKAVWRWANREGIPITVQKIALEREGRIFSRVEFFYEVLKKWQEDIASADYVYFAAHSQGCPVSIILLAKLIEDGIINAENKKVSMLLMAGINNGPFFGADQTLFVRAYSTIESGSLMELFQFQNFDSVHSRELLNSLKTVIKHNIKLTFVGSINDQLVPLYSSTCLHVRHPNIFRATYIDGSSKTPAFVSRALSMANHLHNIGQSDHGVIKEISNSLAGPLTGGGHSTIYNDPQVYDLALNFSLYTNDLRYEIPLHFKPYVIDQLGTNPYHLPWCMRGLLFEARAHWPGAESEIDKLLEEFEAWNPETKQLKDMKYRLNGIKSKL